MTVLKCNKISCNKLLTFHFCKQHQATSINQAQSSHLPNKICQINRSPSWKHILSTSRKQAIRLPSCCICTLQSLLQLQTCNTTLATRMGYELWRHSITSEKLIDELPDVDSRRTRTHKHSTSSLNVTDVPLYCLMFTLRYIILFYFISNSKICIFVLEHWILIR